MKYIATGSLGHISKPLTQQLLKASHEVTVISHSPDRGSDILALGAKPAIGDVTDVAFLTEVFRGADAIYTMVPPVWNAPNWKQHIRTIGANYAAAIRNSGVKKVVNLSSMGAHMPDGCGPVSGLYGVEQELNKVDGIDVLHLRPGFFYYNFLANIPMIRNMSIIGGNYGENSTIAMTHTMDIAAVAASELQALNFTGKSIRYIVSDEKTTDAIAGILGAAINKPELPWVNFKNDDALNGMLGAGLPLEAATNYVEMGMAIASGEMMQHYFSNKSLPLEPTKLEDFAVEFVAAYSAS